MDGVPEVEGKERQDASSYEEQIEGPGSHVHYTIEGDEDHMTMSQKLKEKFGSVGDYLKGKESSEEEDPHPELAYLAPGSDKDLKEGSSGSHQEGKQHGGVPVAAIGKHDHHPPKHEEVLPVTSVSKDETPEIKAADEPVGIQGPRILQKITQKFSEYENQLKGKRPSELEDPHPELAYIPAAPQEAKPSHFFKVKDYFGHQTGSGQGEEETINPAAVPKQTDKGVEAPVASEVQNAEKGVGSNELGTGYEEGSEGSIGHVPKYPEIVVPNVPRETHSEEKAVVDTTSKDANLAPAEESPPSTNMKEAPQTVSSEPLTLDEEHEEQQISSSSDEKNKKPGFFTRMAKKVGGGKKSHNDA